MKIKAKTIYISIIILVLGLVALLIYKNIKDASAAQSDALNFYCKADLDFVSTVVSNWQEAVAEFSSGLASGGGPVASGPPGPPPTPNPGALSWPVSNPVVGQPFCEYCSGGWHGGIDLNFGRPTTDKIYAAASGTVIVASHMCSDPWGHLGNYIVISHVIQGENYTTNYFHLSSISVSPGQYVNQGQAIGNIGNSCTSWVHLHFSLKRGNTYVNPCLFVPDSGEGYQCLAGEGCRLTPATCPGPN